MADIAITIATLLATFAVAFAGGYIGKLLNFPLPWMTGSLLLTAALGFAGVPVRSLWQARAAGQFVTGASPTAAPTASGSSCRMRTLPRSSAASASNAPWTSRSRLPHAGPAARPEGGRQRDPCAWLSPIRRTGVMERWPAFRLPSPP
jgi:hypothetical protein